MDIGILDVLVQLAVALAGVAITFVAAKVNKKTDIDIEQTHINRIKSGVANVAVAAMSDGKTDIKEITSLSMSYLLEQLPQAMAAIKPSNQAVATIALAHMNTAFDMSE